MENKIKAIEKGWDEGSTYFTTEKGKSLPQCTVDEIKEEYKEIHIDSHLPIKSILVYRGYVNGKLVFEIAANEDLTIIYY